MAAPYGQSRLGGGVTLSIWRWQGKASPIKALPDVIKIGIRRRPCDECARDIDMVVQNLAYSTPLLFVRFCR